MNTNGWADGAVAKVRVGVDTQQRKDGVHRLLLARLGVVIVGCCSSIAPQEPRVTECLDRVHKTSDPTSKNMLAPPHKCIVDDEIVGPPKLAWGDPRNPLL